MTIHTCHLKQVILIFFVTTFDITFGSDMVENVAVKKEALTLRQSHIIMAGTQQWGFLKKRGISILSSSYWRSDTFHFWPLSGKKFRVFIVSITLCPGLPLYSTAAVHHHTAEACQEGYQRAFVIWRE